MRDTTAMRWLVWLSLGMAMLLVGCGATTTAKTAGAPSPTATTAPTASPAASPLLTPNTSQLAACGLSSPTGVVRLGDLLAGAGFALAYPSRRLPNDTPLAPFHLASADALDTQLPPDPAVNPNMTADTGGYLLNICNSSPTTAHVIQGVSVRLDSVTPYSGELDAWNACEGVYDAAAKQVEQAGCGGGFCANETLKATFNTAASGTNATVTQLESDKIIAGGCGAVVFGSLPVSLKPHQAIGINIGIALPSAPATYTFAFGVTQDKSASGYLPTSGPTLLAPITHKWTGTACISAAMQSRIPPASTPTNYICPAS